MLFSNVSRLVNSLFSVLCFESLKDSQSRWKEKGLLDCKFRPLPTQRKTSWISWDRSWINLSLTFVYFIVWWFLFQIMERVDVEQKMSIRFLNWTTAECEKFQVTDFPVLWQTATTWQNTDNHIKSTFLLFKSTAILYLWSVQALFVLWCSRQRYETDREKKDPESQSYSLTSAHIFKMFPVYSCGSPKLQGAQWNQRIHTPATSTICCCKSHTEVVCC